ncbi:hypothetical protein PSAC2689_60228 [Paraburkholderia sacchari]
MPHAPRGRARILRIRPPLLRKRHETSAANRFCLRYRLPLVRDRPFLAAPGAEESGRHRRRHARRPSVRAESGHGAGRRNHRRLSRQEIRPHAGADRANAGSDSRARRKRGLHVRAAHAHLQHLRRASPAALGEPQGQAVAAQARAAARLSRRRQGHERPRHTGSSRAIGGTGRRRGAHRVAKRRLCRRSARGRTTRAGNGDSVGAGHHPQPEVSGERRSARRDIRECHQASSSRGLKPPRRSIESIRHFTGDTLSAVSAFKLVLLSLIAIVALELLAKRLRLPPAAALLVGAQHSRG